MKYDFGGYATRNNLTCTDGRVIKKDAFKSQNGETVPLVWNHNHDVDDVLGLAHLENREDGVYAYCEFNDTEKGKTAKELVQHGDVRSLSIFANQLMQKGSDVIHGLIREVSLVIAGANPGAFIDDVIAHGEDGSGIIVCYDEGVTVFMHSDDKPDDEEKTKDRPEDKKKETALKREENRKKSGVKHKKPKQKQAGNGNLSCLFGLGSAAVLAGCIAYAFVRRGEAPGIIGGITIISSILAGYGIYSAIIGFRERERSYLTCKIGIVMNAAAIISFFAVFIRGLN